MESESHDSAVVKVMGSSSGSKRTESIDAPGAGAGTETGTGTGAWAGAGTGAWAWAGTGAWAAGGTRVGEAVYRGVLSGGSVTSASVTGHSPSTSMREVWRREIQFGGMKPILMHRMVVRDTAVNLTAH